jgi:ATP-binding cassette, subfamily B (MDR/TAP), member 1
VAVKATTNIDLISAGISVKFAHIIQALSMIIGALVIGMLQSWKLMLIITAIFMPCFLIMSYTMAAEVDIDARVLQVYSSASNLAEDMLAGVKTVHAFGAVDALLCKFDEWLVRASAIGHCKSPVLAAMYGADFFFSYMPYSVAFWLGTKWYLAGEIAAVGTLWVYVQLSIMLQYLCSMLMHATASFSQS